MGGVSGVQITLLCEDTQTDAFARRFLKHRNFRGRDIRTLALPDGRQSGEQWVRERYPDQLRAIRRRRGAYLIVVTDADRGSTQDRRVQLEAECERKGVPGRQDADRVLMIIPRRNIETWLAYLGGETGRKQIEDCTRTGEASIHDHDGLLDGEESDRRETDAEDGYRARGLNDERQERGDEGTDQNPGIHLYTHERVRPEAYGARAVQLTWAQPRPEISAAWARADNRAA